MLDFEPIGRSGQTGASAGQSCRDAAARLQWARPADRAPPKAREAAFLLITEAPRVLGLLGGRSETALKYDVRSALYNDAGIGKDEAGVSRLPALDARGIPAAAVAAASARIGDARSTYEDGIISRINDRAAALGLREGISARDFVAGLRRWLAR